MALKLRRLEDDEREAFVTSATVSFLALGELDAWRWVVDDESPRAWVVADDDRLVANCGIFTMDLTLPGRPGVPCPVVATAGVSDVGVHPTHRRRGLLTQMMATMIADARNRGEPLAALTVSEGAIYGRFGFGVATRRQSVSIDPRRGAFAVPGPALDLRLMSAGEASKVLPELFDRFRRQRAGEPSRSATWWTELGEDAPARRRGMTGLYVALAEDGYATWRVKDGKQLHLFDLYGATPSVTAGLWRLVLDVDLLDEVVARRRPLDDPLSWRLADPRACTVTSQRDSLWVRVLDVCGALSARAYRDEGRMVIDVVPPVGAPPDVATDRAIGRFVLDAGPDGAECRPAPAGEGTDLRVDLDALGSLLLGGVHPIVLASAGRLDEERPGALSVADRVFPTSAAPFSGTGF